MKGTLKKKITKFNGNSHRTIQNSEIKRLQATHFRKGLQIGELFWVWDQRYSDNNYVTQNIAMCSTFMNYPGHEFDRQYYCKETYIWYSKRQLWGSGPKLPKKLIYPWDATSINKTSIMIVGIWSNSVQKCVSIVFDLFTNNFMKYPDIKFNKSSTIWSMSITTAIQKRSNR